MAETCDITGCGRELEEFHGHLYCPCCCSYLECGCTANEGFGSDHCMSCKCSFCLQNERVSSGGYVTPVAVSS